MLGNIKTALGITENTAPPAQPRANPGYKLNELLNGADRTQPESKITRFPIDQQLRMIDRARSNLVTAEAAVERCQLHLSECQKDADRRLADLYAAQEALQVELINSGAYDRRGEVPRWVQAAMAKHQQETPPETPSE